ncbi:cytochrome b/b6 domain-containing protein [Roseivivax marinus]|uniref:cytochrome b/b6 domain-containing protein n=1 Tax=Roseivivax marinus TaxID=1379903 RepID=UPI00273E6008|nr:cytochrome b/b6 domain-containing protein [Roseivivax marinus]
MTDQNMTGARAAPDTVRPWDPVVRITHWSIAAAVIANGLITKPGGALHVWIGWAAMAVLATRLLWGLIGPREARFSAFPPDPRAALSHLSDLVRGRPREHGSHNPAGAMMAYALWACLVVMIDTGLVMTGGKSPVTITEEKAAVAQGDWSKLVEEGDGGSDHEDGGLGDTVEEVHEVVANLMLLLALLHVAGVVAESRALGRNLARGMVTGQRR